MGQSGTRVEKTYNGELMKKGKQNEECIKTWLETFAKNVLDFREFRLAQRIDVDFGIETIDGKIVLLEAKSDKWIKESGNLCFENNRINHFATDNWFYLGWGWRSPAQRLIVRNPETDDAFLFEFPKLRKYVGQYIAKTGKRTNINITETDKQKTTFNLLIPMSGLKSLYSKYTITESETQ